MALSLKFRRFGRSIYKILCADRYVGFSYSQLGEDRILRELFPRKHKGFYVDLGAYHPTHYSNTQLFHEQGWRGVNVDANPDTIKLFEKHRPEDVNLNVAVSNEPGRALFHRPTTGHSPYGTIDDGMKDHFSNESKMVSHEIESITINQIFSLHVPAEREVDLLNIDLEGMDEKIISSMDFSMKKPKVICVEIHNFDLNSPLQNEVYLKLTRSGYRLVAVCLATAIFQKCD